MNELEKFQNMLNSCLNIGLKTFGYSTDEVECKNYDSVTMWSQDKGVHHVSYHDLFSKDSGLMEFVEWKYQDSIINYSEYSSGKSLIDIPITTSSVMFHYMIMGTLSANDKIIYFNNNAIIPGLD